MEIRLLLSRSGRKRPVWWRPWAWWDSSRSRSVEVVTQRSEGGGVLNGVLDSWCRHFDCEVGKVRRSCFYTAFWIGQPNYISVSEKMTLKIIG